MPRGFDTAIAALRQLPERQRQKAEQALRDIAPQVAQHIRDGAPFQDETGATRAGIAVYLADDAGSALGEAVSAAEGLNEGHAVRRSIDRTPGAVELVATSVTDYSAYLEADGAGRYAFLHSGLITSLPMITAAVAEALRDEGAE